MSQPLPYHLRTWAKSQLLKLSAFHFLLFNLGVRVLPSGVVVNVAEFTVRFQLIYYFLISLPILQPFSTWDTTHGLTYVNPLFHWEKSTREQNNPTFASSISKVKILSQTSVGRTYAGPGVPPATLSQTPERKFPGHGMVKSKREYQKDRH